MGDRDKLNKAITLANAGDYAGAAKEMSAVSPDSPLLATTQVMSLHGVILWRGERKLEEAAAKFEKVLEQMPEDPGTLQNYNQVLIAIKVDKAKKGNQMRQAGQYAEAAEMYNSIDLDDPVSPDLRFHVANNFGIVLKQIGRSHEALQAFETALEMEPTCLEAQFNRAVLLKEASQFEAAIEAFDGIIETHADKVEQVKFCILGKLECFAQLANIEAEEPIGYEDVVMLEEEEAPVVTAPEEGEGEDKVEGEGEGEGEGEAAPPAAPAEGEEAAEAAPPAAPVEGEEAAAAEVTPVEEEEEAAAAAAAPVPLEDEAVPAEPKFVDLLIDMCTDIIDNEKLEGDFHPYYYRAYAHVIKSDYPPAITDMQLAMSIIGETGTPPAAEYNKVLETRQTAHGKYGEELYAQNDAAGAVENYDMALDELYLPQDNGATRIIMFNKALALLDLNRLDESMTLLKRIIKLYPDYWKAYEALGQLALMLEQWELAVEVLSVALDGDRATPDKADLVYNLGIAYYKLGIAAEADRPKFVELITAARDTFQRNVDNLPEEHEQYDPSVKARDAMNELLRLREINDPVFETPVPTEIPDYIPGPFDGEKEGYTFAENGPKGPGYYRDFIPVADRKSGSGEKDGYVFMPDGPQGQGYYKLPDDGKKYYIPGDFDGPKEGYTYRKKGPLGDGYYLDDEYMPGLRKFKINRTGEQDRFIKKDKTYSSDPEIARLEKLGWSPDLIAMSLKLAKKGGTEFHGQGQAPVTYGARGAAAQEQEGGANAYNVYGRPNGSAIKVVEKTNSGRDAMQFEYSDGYKPGQGAPDQDGFAGHSQAGLRHVEREGKAAAEEVVGSPIGDGNYGQWGSGPAPSPLAKQKSMKYTPWKDLVVPYAQLQSPGPFDPKVDPTQRELYMSEEEFQAVMGTTKDAWLLVPKWKRANAKKKKGLF